MQSKTDQYGGGSNQVGVQRIRLPGIDTTVIVDVFIYLPSQEALKEPVIIQPSLSITSATKPTNMTFFKQQKLYERYSVCFCLPCSVEKYFDVSNVRFNMYVPVCVSVCVCFSLDKNFSNEISFTERRRTSE